MLSKTVPENPSPLVKQMPNPDALWEDIQKLDDLYEELLWDHADELQFTHDGKRVIIINKTQENNK